jgi:hypothetical protein
MSMKVEPAIQIELDNILFDAFTLPWPIEEM